jgi:hypothetical protein
VWNRIYSSVSFYVGTYVNTRVCACVSFSPLQGHTPNFNMRTAHRGRVVVETERDLQRVAGNIFREICNSLISFPMYRLGYYCHSLFSQNSLLVRHIYKKIYEEIMEMLRGWSTVWAVVSYKIQKHVE